MNDKDKSIPYTTDNKTKLQEILGKYEEQTIAKAMFDWDKDMVFYEGASKKQNVLEHTKLSLESVIEGLEAGLSALKRSQTRKLYIHQPFFNPPPDISILIQDVEFHLNLHKATLNYVKWAKSFLFDKDAMFLLAMIKVFTLGENLGLKPSHQIGSGKGNKSQLLTFVEVITQITDRKKLRRYQGLYEKFKTDVQYSSKVLSLPQLISLKPCITSNPV